MTTPNVTAESFRFDLLISGVLVLPGRTVSKGWIGISQGKIAAIGEGPRPEAARVYDAGSAYVMPGFIDGQTHATSAGGLPGIRSTTRAAAAGGVTTLVDMPYDNPDPLNSIERLERKIEAISQCSSADMALYGTVAPDQDVQQMERLAKAGVAAFKLSSFDVHPVRFPRITADHMLDILAASAPLGLPVGLHNEDQDIIRASTDALKRKGLQTPEWHARSRPIAAELSATASFLALGLATGAHAHIVHISCPEGYQMVQRFREMGTHGTAEMCAHYLHFDAARDMARLGARMKVNPPIREGVLPALWDAFRNEQIDFVSSDHSSWPLSKKLTTSIFDAGAGIPGIETLVPSFYTDLMTQVDQPHQALALYLAERPAAFFGLAKKGRLDLGMDADVAILEPGAHVFDESQTHDELNWSPYTGETFAGRIVATFLRGTMVWDGKQVLAEPGIGRYVARESG